MSKIESNISSHNYAPGGNSPLAISESRVSMDADAARVRKEEDWQAFLEKLGPVGKLFSSKKLGQK